MDSLTEKPTFFVFMFTPWNRSNFFYEPEIVWFSAITSEETLLKKTFRF